LIAAIKSLALPQPNMPEHVPITSLLVIKLIILSHRQINVKEHEVFLGHIDDFVKNTLGKPTIGL
jgi:hypothetical protein